MDHQNRWQQPLRHEVAVVAVSADDAGDPIRAGVDSIDREVGAGRAADEKDLIGIPAVFGHVRAHPLDRGHTVGELFLVADVWTQPVIGARADHALTDQMPNQRSGLAALVPRVKAAAVEVQHHRYAGRTVPTVVHIEDTARAFAV